MATALPLVNVTVRIVDQDGDPVIGAKISAKLTTVERYQGYVIPQEYLGQTDDQGTCIVRLFPNELGTEGSEYRFKISYSTTPVSDGKSIQSCHIGGTGCYSSSGKTLTVYASIPNSDCNLEDVCDLDPYPVRGSGQLITEQVLAASQQASTAAKEAIDAADQIKVDIDAAKDSADIATSQASIATAGADRAQLKADVADARAKSAESWAEKAKAWAESETPPDPDDPDSKSAKTWAKFFKGGDGITVNKDGTFSVDVWMMFPPRLPVAIEGVSFGGSDGRRAIMPGETEAREDWILCDGGSDGKGGTVPDLRGRMIRGASDSVPAGSTGGSETHSHSLSGTVGETTLTVEQLASHKHSYTDEHSSEGYGSPGDNSWGYISETKVTAPSGGSKSHTHTLSGASGSANSLPPYYALSYIMRIL